MIARSEEEFNLFQRMDSERKRQEDESVPRLISEAELPDFLLRGEDEVRICSSMEVTEASRKDGFYGKL